MMMAVMLKCIYQLWVFVCIKCPYRSNGDGSNVKVYISVVGFLYVLNVLTLLMWWQKKNSIKIFLHGVICVKNLKKNHFRIYVGTQLNHIIIVIVALILYLFFFSNFQGTLRKAVSPFLSGKIWYILWKHNNVWKLLQILARLCYIYFRCNHHTPCNTWYYLITYWRLV